jgi:hypothetical protein
LGSIWLGQQVFLGIAAILEVAWAELRQRILRQIPVQASTTERYQPSEAIREGLLTARDFQLINEPGFGDKWNGWPWSMQWWHGKLYVGTGRAVQCLEYVALKAALPYALHYPPRIDPDVKCAACPYDLPLQAEIWRYTPEARAWERMVQSEATVTLPDNPGKGIARDIGYRNMIVYTEADGTEALYVATVTARVIDRAAPPPRLLRSTDGVTFTAVPATPGTVMGDLQADSLRALAIYNKRLYVVAGRLFGDGLVLESENPAGGDNHFRQITPAHIRVNEMAVFNGFLYLGLRQPLKGYSVVKTDASGTPPYRFMPVIPHGGGRKVWRSHTVMSMYVFQNRLYVGTESPAELICIYPDDSWDLVAGKPRRALGHTKYPLSGKGDGFGYALNRRVYRMREHDGWLYVGLGSDLAVKCRNVPILGPLVRPDMGFDIVATPNGIHFSTVTRTGLDDETASDVRSFASTPEGLFLGAINDFVGAKVYLGKRGP